MRKHDTDFDFTQVQVTEFPWQENDEIYTWFVVIFDQIAVKETRETLCYIFTELHFFVGGSENPF